MQTWELEYSGCKLELWPRHKVTKMEIQRKFDEPVISQNTITLTEYIKGQVFKLEEICEVGFFKGSCTMTNAPSKHTQKLWGWYIPFL